MANSTTTKRANAGKLQLVRAASNDSFPADMRRAIEKAAEKRGLPKWHLELSIDRPTQGEQPASVIRFKRNFPKGMRNHIKQQLGSSDWCLQMTLKDGDGASNASGDDDGSGAWVGSGSGGGAGSAAAKKKAVKKTSKAPAKKKSTKKAAKK